MGIFIKNAETVRKARELAARRGGGLTATIDEALDLLNQHDLANKKKRPTLDDLMAATAALHAATGYRPGSHPPVTKAEWDELNAIGYPELDDA